MYHSVIFGDKNTYDDWKIVPSERPVFSPPQQKTTYLDIPGANGSLDVSDSLTGYPVFEDREGSFNFYVLNQEDGIKNYNWTTTYSAIMNYLHGRQMKVILEDDPKWYYNGRFWVGDWSPDANHSKISIKYRVGPYKWSVESMSSPDWLWDPFNFLTDEVFGDIFSNIEVTSSSTWTEVTFKSDENPTPVLLCYNIASQSGNGMDMYRKFGDLDRRIDKHLPDGSTEETVMMLPGSNVVAFKGVGSVSIDFRKGML